MGDNPPKFLRIRVEGSFCVVIQKDHSYQIRVCTIANTAHHFAVNGQEIKYKQGASFHFVLSPDGLATYNSWPDIDPAFDWSNKKTGKWNNDDSYYFITMDVPCPQEIMQDGTTRAIFADYSSGLMPLNHILTYEIQNSDQVRITCNELGGRQNIPDGIFQLEVGLPRGTSSSTIHDHAIMFYNDMVQMLFPDLYNDSKCRLKDIEVRPLPQPGSTGSRTTTFECKSGGMIVGV